MLKTPVLTDEHLQDFQDQGFLVVRGAFDQRAMALIDSWTRELLALPEESGTH